MPKVKESSKHTGLSLVQEAQRDLLERQRQRLEKTIKACGSDWSNAILRHMHRHMHRHCNFCEPGVAALPAAFKMSLDRGMPSTTHKLVEMSTTLRPAMRRKVLPTVGGTLYHHGHNQARQDGRQAARHFRDNGLGTLLAKSEQESHGATSEREKRPSKEFSIDVGLVLLVKIEPRKTIRWKQIRE